MKLRNIKKDPEKFHEWINNNPPEGSVYICVGKIEKKKKDKSQVKQDDPGTISYTVEEILNLIELNPSPEDLRRIHEVKEVFHDSKIVDSTLKETID